MSLNAKDLFLSGGYFMWPLLALSVLSIALIVERFIYYQLGKYRVGPTINLLETAVSNGTSITSRKRNPLVQFALTAIPTAPGGSTHFENIAEREASRILNRHERGLRLLGLIGSISPLIGLLGTVWGMVIAFSKISALGASVTPADFADGISIGLLTTVAGLAVAIPAVASARLYEARVDKLAHDLNEVASHLREWLFPTETTDES